MMPTKLIARSATEVQAEVTSGVAAQQVLAFASMISWACRNKQQYYQKYARENFVTWNDEQDPDRIAALITKGYDDTAYIVKTVRS